MEKEMKIILILNKISYEIEKHINDGYAEDMLVPLEFDVVHWNLLMGYIDNLQTQLKKQKEIIDRTISAIDLVIELIKQQPTEDDSWILDRLNGFKIILEDKEV